MQAADSTPPGVVELREDIPLKTGAPAAGGCGGPRLIAACFAALSAAVTVALLTQIYYGDYQVVPHGSVSSAAEACSAAGTRALKAGGRALDAAAAAAVCLALLAPHRTSLDAMITLCDCSCLNTNGQPQDPGYFEVSGSLLYWEYRSREARAAGPVLAEWGGVAGAGDGGGGAGAARAPRLLAALAQLHAQHGALPWRQVLQPTIDLARSGFPVSRELSSAAAAAGRGGWPAGGARRDPPLADYLQSLQHNTSAELSAEWSNNTVAVRFPPAQAAAAGGWRLYAGGAGAAAAARALAAGLAPPPVDADDAERRVVSALINEAQSVTWPPGGVATGLAVVDSSDTYVALVTGLSLPFGSLPPWGLDGADAGAGGEGSAAAARDAPGAPLDLAPAILLDDNVCGTRYVMGGESSAALAQAAVALAADGAALGAGGVERARVAVLPGGALAVESVAPAALAPLAGPALNATRPYAAVNVVQQRGDTLASHADSRSGGLASRF